MGRLLTALLLATLLLAGCGEDASDPAAAASSSTPSPSEPEMSAGDPVQEPTVVALVSGTNAGGRVSATPVPVGDPQDLATFIRPLDGPLLRDVASAARDAEVPDGQTLLAAVVAIGCEPPGSVTVEVRDGGPRIVVPQQKSDKRCFASVTTVALVTAVG